MTETATRSNITLKGSAQMIQEFFFYGINSILYQRGIYPSDTFDRVKQYGMTLLVTKDHKLQQFLKPLLGQVELWLSKRLLKKLVLLLSDVSTKEVLERWQFDIENESEEGETKQKDEKRIKQEIADVIRQITASVAFLPLLESQCAFDVLIYTGKEVEMPADWADSSACLLTLHDSSMYDFNTEFLVVNYIKLNQNARALYFGISSIATHDNAEEVQLRMFSTGIHKVQTKVQYKADL